MATRTKTTASKKTVKKAAPKKAAKSKIETTPIADPCAKGHKWDKDVEGVGHCTVGLVDRKEIEKAIKKKAAKTKPTKTKLSALNAAAEVLASSTEPLNTKQKIEQMAAKELWTSPGVKMPHATLYSAILREIQAKGRGRRDSRRQSVGTSPRIADAHTDESPSGGLPSLIICSGNLGSLASRKCRMPYMPRTIPER